jgi:hypothetical protein
MTNDICPHCAERGVFGYRDKQTGEMTWYCTAHRLGQFWADARRDVSPAIPTEGWKDRGSA